MKMVVLPFFDMNFPISDELIHETISKMLI